MLKTSTIALICLVTAASAARAQGRPDSTTMPCSRAAALVRSQGALVLGTGGRTYDRFVVDRNFCESTQQTKAAFVPAADTASCFVGYTCIDPFMITPGIR